MNLTQIKTNNRYDHEGSLIEYGFKEQEFHFVFPVAVKTSERTKLISQLKASQRDFHQWRPDDTTRSGYLYELGLRNTWVDENPVFCPGLPELDFEYFQLTHRYHWESHWDGSLPDGVQCTVPSPWLIELLGLHLSREDAGVFLDQSGSPVFISGSKDGDEWAIANRNKLITALKAEGLEMIWLAIGERMAWPDPVDDKCLYNRWNGVMWLTGKGPRFETWREESGNKE